MSYTNIAKLHKVVNLPTVPAFIEEDAPDADKVNFRNMSSSVFSFCIFLVPGKLFEQVISLPENDAILAQLKRLTPLAKAMLVPDLTEDEIKAALGEDEV